MSAETPSNTAAIRTIPVRYSYLILTSSWKVLKNYYGIILGVTVFQFVVIFAATKVPVIGQILAGLISVALSPGMWRMCQRWVKGQPSKFEDQFSLFSDSELFGRMIPLFALTFVFNGMAALIIWRSALSGGTPTITDALAWMSPIYLIYGLFTTYSGPQIVLQGKKLKDTFLPSASGILKNLGPLFLLILLYILLAIISTLALLLPLLLITLPMTYFIFYLTFATIFDGLMLPEGVQTPTPAAPPESTNT